jgi:hypothetical protein
VHHVVTSRGAFSTEFQLAGDAPDGAWLVRAFCDYGSDGAEADFVVMSTLPRTGGELGLLAAVGGFLLAAGTICFAPRRPGPPVAKDMASGQRR